MPNGRRGGVRGATGSPYSIEKNMTEGMLKTTAIGKKQIREQGKKLFLRNREKTTLIRLLLLKRRRAQQMQRI